MSTLSPARKRPRLTWVVVGACVAAAVIGMIGAAIVMALDSDDPLEFAGTALGGTPAYGFTLTDQHGERVSLVEQRGKVTVLTFLYTHCPDICPLTAAQLRIAQDQLGEEANQVSMLAVSVDPERDTVAQAYAFSEKFGLENRWSYVVGSRQELEPIWEHYFVGVAVESEIAAESTHEDADKHDDDLLHTAPVFLIDHEGNLQVVHTTGNDPSAITSNLLHDIRLLVAEIPGSG